MSELDKGRVPLERVQDGPALASGELDVEHDEAAGLFANGVEALDPDGAGKRGAGAVAAVFDPDAKVLGARGSGVAGRSRRSADHYKGAGKQVDGQQQLR